MIQDELRIGNWICATMPDYDFQTEERKVSGVTYEHCHTDLPIRGGTWNNWEDIEPIPLTIEWLERCGFTWDEENQVYSIQIGNALYLEYDKDFDCAINPESWPGGSTYVWGENKSVHRLQNLFYDLTGKQLEITPL